MRKSNREEIKKQILFSKWFHYSKKVQELEYQQLEKLVIYGERPLEMTHDQYKNEVIQKAI